MSRTRKFRLTAEQDREIDRAMLLHAREQFVLELAAALDEAASETPEPNDPPLMHLMS
jgi:hypothetical protein